jgi:hypothetical protein
VEVKTPLHADVFTEIFKECEPFSHTRKPDVGIPFTSVYVEWVIAEDYSYLQSTHCTPQWVQHLAIALYDEMRHYVIVKPWGSVLVSYDGFPLTSGILGWGQLARILPGTDMLDIQVPLIPERLELGYTTKGDIHTVLSQKL